MDDISIFIYSSYKDFNFMGIVDKKLIHFYVKQYMGVK